MTELTPYDTGERLEPQLWVRGETASPGGLPRRATASDYGRVDFDADDGTTILTLHIERVTNGYRMHVDSHSDDYLHVIGANEPPALQGPAAELDVDYRAEQMMLLDTQLRQIGVHHSEHVVLYDGDPLAFSPGHLVFHELEGRRWFAIEELYPTGDAWEDPDRVPIGWAWREQGPRALAGRIRRTADRRRGHHHPLRHRPPGRSSTAMGARRIRTGHRRGDAGPGPVYAAQRDASRQPIHLAPAGPGTYLAGDRLDRKAPRCLVTTPPTSVADAG